jgi:hypothetical protein
MGELDRKDKAKKDKAASDKKRRDEANDDAVGDGTHLLAWDADVEKFMEVLERMLGGMRTAMTSGEFKTLCVAYRELSQAEKRAVANRLSRKGLANLTRALHSGDFRLYLDHWQAESEAVQKASSGVDAGTDPDP